jgi:hypothetical protein
MNELLIWAKTHPELAFALTSCFVTALFHPRTDAEYAAMPPQLAAFFKFVAAVGVDPIRMMAAIKTVLTGKGSP